jgi:hypothetical protein
MGEIKEGKGTIIGNAGEYLVVGELLKRKIIAAPAPRGNPGFDVLATDGTNSLNIRVKTKTEASDSWVWVCKKDKQRTLFKNLRNQSDFIVLVDLKDPQTSPEYYIFPTIELDKRLRDIFDYWVKSPPKRGKPHDPNSRVFRIGFTLHQKDWLSKGKGNWALILDDLKPTPSPSPPHLSCCLPSHLVWLPAGALKSP